MFQPTWKPSPKVLVQPIKPSLLFSIEQMSLSVHPLFPREVWPNPYTASSQNYSSAYVETSNSLRIIAQPTWPSAQLPVVNLIDSGPAIACYMPLSDWSWFQLFLALACSGRFQFWTGPVSGRFLRMDLMRVLAFLHRIAID